jgi:hypothetical protein
VESLGGFAAAAHRQPPVLLQILPGEPPVHHLREGRCVRLEGGVGVAAARQGVQATGPERQPPGRARLALDRQHVRPIAASLVAPHDRRDVQLQQHRQQEPGTLGIEVGVPPE